MEKRTKNLAARFHPALRCASKSTQEMQEMTGTAAPAEEKPGSKHRVLVCRGWSHEASIAGTDTGRAGPVFSPFSPKSHLHGAPRGCGGTGAALRVKSPGGKEKGKGTQPREGSEEEGRGQQKDDVVGWQCCNLELSNHVCVLYSNMTVN